MLIAQTGRNAASSLLEWVMSNCKSPDVFSTELARGVGDWFERERERERWFTGRDKRD